MEGGGEKSSWMMSVMGGRGEKQLDDVNNGEGSIWMMSVMGGGGIWKQGTEAMSVPERTYHAAVSALTLDATCYQI